MPLALTPHVHRARTPSVENLDVPLAVEVADRHAASRIDWTIAAGKDRLDGLTGGHELREELTLTRRCRID